MYPGPRLVPSFQVKRDARIGEAEARRDAGIKEAIAEEQRMAARFQNDVEIAKAERDFHLKKASYDREVQTKKSQADMAYDLQVSEMNEFHKMNEWMNERLND